MALEYAEVSFFEKPSPHTESFEIPFLHITSKLLKRLLPSYHFQHQGELQLHGLWESFKLNKE